MFCPKIYLIKFFNPPLGDLTTPINIVYNIDEDSIVNINSIIWNGFWQEFFLRMNNEYQGKDFTKGCQIRLVFLGYIRVSCPKFN